MLLLWVDVFSQPNMMAVAFQVAAIIVPFASPRIPSQQEVQKFGAGEAGRAKQL